MRQTKITNDSPWYRGRVARSNYGNRARSATLSPHYGRIITDGSVTCNSMKYQIIYVIKVVGRSLWRAICTSARA